MSFFRQMITAFTFVSLHGFAHAQSMGYPGGELRGASDFGTFPTISPRGWDAPDLPTYNEGGGRYEGPTGIPTPMDLITGGSPIGEPIIDNDFEEDYRPVPEDTIQDWQPNITLDPAAPVVNDDATNPTGLSLPDPGMGPETPVFPMPNFLSQILPADVLTQYQRNPWISTDVLPSEVEDCDQLPEYSGIDYAMDLRNPELSEEDYIELHTLWIKLRMCRNDGVITPEEARVRVLNNNDHRCVFYTGQNFRDDLRLAESEDEEQVIKALYQQYFFNCF